MTDFRKCEFYQEKAGCMDTGWCRYRTPRIGFPVPCESEKHGWECDDFPERQAREQS